MATQSTDIFVTSGDALDFTSAGETLTISSGVTVAAESGGLFGVYSNGNANTLLINDGTVYNANSGSFSVVLENGDSDVNNTATGLILGIGSGLVEAGNGNDIVTNAGIIAGESTVIGVGATFQGSPVSLNFTNSGYIFGATKGILIQTSSVGGFISNSGAINSNGPAIYVDTGPALVTQITNFAGGVIAFIPASAGDVIFANNGMFHLTNHGTIIGNVRDADNLSDVIINSGKINGSVFLGGNSVFSGTGGTSGPIFVGGGSDTLTGGPGPDTFAFFSPLLGQVDKITNFTPKQHDQIILSETDFPHIGPLGTLKAGFFNAGPAMTANQHIIYNQTTGFLYYDSNGSHPGGLHHFATLSSHPTLTHADFIVQA